MKGSKLAVLFLVSVLLAAAGSNACAASNPQYPISNTLSTAALCPPLVPPTGPTIIVATEAGLRDQAYNAAAGTAIGKALAGLDSGTGIIQMLVMLQ
jgi:hypothetical protein